MHAFEQTTQFTFEGQQLLVYTTGMNRKYIRALQIKCTVLLLLLFLLVRMMTSFLHEIGKRCFMMFVCLACCMWCHSAFDTLAKALNPSEGMEAQSLSEVEGIGGPTIQVISRDHITPLIEVEGPLLTDAHVNFKVCNGTEHNST